jgi:hypothetical protein
MPSFEQEFINSKGMPVIYKGIELIGMDRVPVKENFSGHLRVISINSEWEQCIRMRVEGSITIESDTGKNFVLWANGIKGDVHFIGKSKNKQLYIWNGWRRKDGGVDAWLNGAAMIAEINGNTRRYKCNDGHPDDNFDDLIFEVVIDE